jgi:hypothetical protein
MAPVGRLHSGVLGRYEISVEVAPVALHRKTSALPGEFSH